MRAGISKSVIDNFVHVPCLYLPTFYSWVGLVQGQSSEAILSAMNQDVVHVTLLHAAVFVPGMAFVFGVVPVYLRLLVVNASNLLWTVFLSHCSQTGSGKGTRALAW